jgi:hypothetical protein
MRLGGGAGDAMGSRPASALGSVTLKVKRHQPALAVELRDIYASFGLGLCGYTPRCGAQLRFPYIRHNQAFIRYKRLKVLPSGTHLPRGVHSRSQASLFRTVVHISRSSSGPLLLV